MCHFRNFNLSKEDDEVEEKEQKLTKEPVK